MTGAAVTEETIIGIGILSHGSRRDSRLLQLAQRIARQVKTKMVRGVIIDEIRLCPRGGGDDLIPQVWPDLIGCLLDGGADHGTNTVKTGTKRLHPFDCAADNALDGTAPASMGSTDHACLRISEKHRGAIRGQDGQNQPGPVGNEGITLPPGAIIGDQRGGGMDLIKPPDIIGCPAQGSSGGGPVGFNIAGIVV